MSFKLVIESRQWRQQPVKVVMFEASVTGEKHKELNLPNQDAVVIRIEDDYALLAVADGLGSCRFSDHGSKYAVEAVCEIVEEQLNINQGIIKKELPNLVINRWYQKIGDQSAKDFDTTLLFAVIQEDYIFIAGLGDGMVQWKTGSCDSQELFDQKVQFSNQTYSITAENSENCLVMKGIEYKPEDLPITLVMATDGISEDLVPESRPYFSSYLTEKIMSESPNKFAEELDEWIRSWENPNGDDRTMVFLTLSSE